MTLQTHPLPTMSPHLSTRHFLPKSSLKMKSWARLYGLAALASSCSSSHCYRHPSARWRTRADIANRFLIFFTFLAVIFTALLYFPQQGQVTFAIAIYIIACICFEMGTVFYNAFLPDIAPPERIGRISGQAWGVGYLGGLLSMAVLMVGFVSAETPWFGLSKETHEHIRATNIGVAIWFAIFSLPALFYLPEPPARQTGDKLSLAASYRRILQTFRELQHYREIFKLLLARLVYNDGLVTVFAFGGIYASGTFGFTFEEVLFFGIIVNIAAGIGAWCFGYLDDRLGGKLTIQITLIGFVIAATIAVVPQEKIWFWIAGILVGLFAGPNQSASRSLMGRFVPNKQRNRILRLLRLLGKSHGISRSPPHGRPHTSLPISAHRHGNRGPVLHRRPASSCAPLTNKRASAWDVKKRHRRQTSNAKSRPSTSLNLNIEIEVSLDNYLSYCHIIL